MKKTQLISALLLGFVILSVLLSGIGIIDVSMNQIFNYSIITLGIMMVYPGFTDNNKILIFFGSAVFLIGVVFLVQTDYEVYDLDKITTSLVLIISGSSLFIVFVSDTNNKLLLIFSAILWIAGMVLLLINSSIEAGRFFQAIINVGLNFWYIFLLALIIIVLFNRWAKD